MIHVRNKKMALLNHDNLLEQLRKFRLVPVVTLPSVRAALKLSEILLRCSLPVAEITFRTSCAREGVTAIKREQPELLVIAGTILTPRQALTLLSALAFPKDRRRLAVRMTIFFPWGMYTN